MPYIMIGIALIVVLIVVLVFFFTKQAFQNKLIKIHTAETEIEELLNKKLDLIKRTIPFIKENHPEEMRRLEELEEINEKVPNNFELYKSLAKLYHEIKLIVTEHDELEEIEQFETILDFLLEADDFLTAATNYYNDTVKEYQILFHKFPYNITKKLCHFEEKPMYYKEKLEDFEILKEKNK